uniref:Uncharacterized protein n=1 Tax=Romanomermis culicivorax TaxID=13658 RepID=A0A915JE15_ROMCU
MFALGMHFRREREAERRAALLRKKHSDELFSPPPSVNCDNHLLNSNSNNNTNANNSNIKSGKKTSSVGQGRQISNVDPHQQTLTAGKYATRHIESRT